MRPGPRGDGIALLLIDVLNPLTFRGGAALARHALPAAERIAALRQRLTARGVPVVYVNDNFGHWHLGLREILDELIAQRPPGLPLLERLAPAARDHFVLKPQLSGFYNTSLELLLGHLHVRTLVLTGFAGDICVQCTAHDAHMRGYDLIVPRDCIASEDPDDNAHALRHMARVLDADVRPADEI